MVHFGTPRVRPINTPNIGPIDEELISISVKESHRLSPVKRIKAHNISYEGITTKLLRPNGGWSISGPQGSVLSTPQILDPSLKDWYQYRPWNLTHRISLKNQWIWHIIRRLYYQIAAAQWRMVHFGTPRVGPIHTPNIGHIDEGLISISTMKSHL